MSDTPQNDSLANTPDASFQDDALNDSVSEMPVPGADEFPSAPMRASESPYDTAANGMQSYAAAPVTAAQAPLAASVQPVIAHPMPDVVVIPRHTFNYVVIGVTFLILGLVMGAIGYNQFSTARAADNNTLINAAIGTAVAALPLNFAPTPRPTLDPRIRYSIDEGGNPAIGPEDAPITMIEFGDFSCTYCKRFNDQTLAPLLAAYEGQVRFVFRDYPILGPNSIQAALAGECADDQEQFWAFHDRIYGDPQNLTRDAFITYATELEMNVATFTTCLDDGVHQEEVTADYNAGTSLNVFNGTPTFFINGKILIGAQPYAAFQQIIDSELAIFNGTATEEAAPTPVPSA